jgi:hypothetical protein
MCNRQLSFDILPTNTYRLKPSLDVLQRPVVFSIPDPILAHLFVIGLHCVRFPFVCDIWFRFRFIYPLSANNGRFEQAAMAEPDSFSNG